MRKEIVVEQYNGNEWVTLEWFPRANEVTLDYALHLARQWRAVDSWHLPVRVRVLGRVVYI